MIEAVSFKTRARTIDHLGREQIADCPTAVSELWKNAYDAYATEVALHIFDGDVPIALVADDGHGMSREEFIDKWLVVGTESKATGEKVLEDDRNGLPYRPKQGQKGIGRLSSAALGPLLLLVSKRKNRPYAAALIDWRIFENPFLFLQDIEIPVVEFDERAKLYELLPSMFDSLMSNLWGSAKKEKEKEKEKERVLRNERVKNAWRDYDELEKSEDRASTQKAIENVIIGTTFNDRHLDKWPIWTGKKTHGTALFIADIAFDLTAQLDSENPDSTVKHAQAAVFQTLSNFTDPFVDRKEKEVGQKLAAEDFKYTVTAWEGVLSRPIVSDEKEVDYGFLEELEHVVDGEIDASGVFKGKVKAFGQWLEGEIIIEPKINLPSRSDTKVGHFHFRIGTFEQENDKTTHSPQIFSHLEEMAEKYAGFMIYRNGLRVMPYGREDNDFFEIEKRRSKHFGREFWSYRRIFGRIALSRDGNPNLKDKAGREGIIENRAAKAFRDIVINILTTTARKYFGSDSQLRKVWEPQWKKEKAYKKAEEAEKALRIRKRKELRLKLNEFLPELDRIMKELDELVRLAQGDHLPDDLEQLSKLLERLTLTQNKLGEMSSIVISADVGNQEEKHRTFRKNYKKAAELVERLHDTFAQILEKIKSQSAREMALADLEAHAAFIRQRLLRWSQEARGILDSETVRLASLVDERAQEYRAKTLPLLDDLDHGRMSLSKVRAEFDKERMEQDRENAELFESYISTLKNLQESIDIESLLSFSMEKSEELRKELDRLNALAQLGITVEIIGHEIEGLEMTISHGLAEMPKAVKNSEAFKEIKTAHEMLLDRLRFLSPLKLSGEKVKSWIDGENIVKYVRSFMGDALDRRGIKLEVSPAFKKFSAYEQPSRLYPVFINLINNAAFWVEMSKEKSRKVLLDVADGKVIVADNGPGVEEDDVKDLFTLFFTRKVRGGRGVGLYLCRANLAAGGHGIIYVTDPDHKLLPGANFMIDLKGAKYA